MNPGALNKRLIFQKPAETRTSTGGFATTYPEKDWLPLWAAVWPMKNKEAAEAHKLEGKVYRRIRIRYRAVITEKWRVYWEAKDIYMSLTSPPSDPGERREYMDFISQEIST